MIKLPKVREPEKLSFVGGDEGDILFPTIPDLVEYWSKHSPEKEAFVVYTPSGDRTSITYGELYSKCRQFASKLYDLGIRKGDVVLIILGNSIEWLVVEYGVMILGAIAFNSYASRRDLSDLDHVVKTSSPSAYVFELDQEAAPIHAEHIAKLALDKPVICVGKDKPKGTFFNFSDLMKRDTENTWDTNIDPDDPVVIMRSSGTTGRSKLTLWSHRGVLAIFRLFREKTIPSTSEIRITNADFGWMAGSPLFELVCGSTAISCSHLDLSMNIQELFNIMDRESATSLLPTPDVYNRMVAMKPMPNVPESMKSFVFGGSPAKEEWTELLEYIPNGFAAYGCLEMGLISIKQFSRERGDVIGNNIGGRPSDGVEVKITNEGGKMVDRNVIGNICARCKYRFLGYYGDDHMTSKHVTRSNWYTTGDVGYIDDGGQLYVIGRLQEAITKGSITTYASEIEKEVKELNIKHIVELVVVPVPDGVYGQVNCFCVVTTAACNISEEELQKAISDQFDLDSDSKPDFLIFIPDIPYNINGKVDRPTLVKRAREQIGR